MAVMRGNRVGGNWLMKWDEVKKKSHYTLIDWRTGREWPLNWMTVISAQWRSHRPFQRKRKWHIPVARYRKELRRACPYYRVWVWRWYKADELNRGQLSSGQLSSTSQWRQASRVEELDERVRKASAPVEQPWRTRKTQRWRP